MYIGPQFSMWLFSRFVKGFMAIIKVGEEFLLNCGIGVKVLECENSEFIEIADGDGNKKIVNSLNLLAGNVYWEWCRGGKSNPVIGDKYTLNCGAEVFVTKFVKRDEVTVEDSHGNSKITRCSDLSKGHVGWKEFGYSSSHSGLPNTNTGSVFTLVCGVVVTVVRYVDCYNITVEDADGNRKTTSAVLLRCGKVGWSEFGASWNTKTHKTFPIDSVWESKKYGKFTIEAVAGNAKITVKWADSGFVQEKCSSKSILVGSLIDRSISPKRRVVEHLPLGFYVYLVHYKGEVLYIGKGKGNRYLHTTSGTSHVLGLNRLFFNGETVVVSILKDKLSEEDALALEREQIMIQNPKFNTMLRV